MKLSTRSRYGARMMLDLARHGQNGPIHIKEIARRQDISGKYLEQLIIPLKRAGLIQSVRGPKGGYRLSMAPERITFADIIGALEGQWVLVDCIEHPDICHRESRCVVRKVWEQATQAMLDTLRATTLSDMLQKG